MWYDNQWKFKMWYENQWQCKMWYDNDNLKYLHPLQVGESIRWGLHLLTPFPPLIIMIIIINVDYNDYEYHDDFDDYDESVRGCLHLCNTFSYFRWIFQISRSTSCYYIQMDGSIHNMSGPTSRYSHKWHTCSSAFLEGY